MDYKPAEAAKLLGVTVKTLQRWDQGGVFKARRTPTNRRYYTKEQIKEYLKGGKSNMMTDLVEGKYMLCWKDNPEDYDIVRDEQGIAKVFVVPRDEGDTDVLYELIFGDYSVDFDINGIPINDVFVYNLLYNHIVAQYLIGEYDDGNTNAGKVLHELLEEHSTNKKTSKIVRMAKEYLLAKLAE